MDYQRFIEQLPGLYANWGNASLHPQSEAFDVVLDQVKGTTTANVMQLLNFAVECMEADEVYCEIGCASGANLIGALLNHPLQMAYAVDNFTQAENEKNKIEELSKNLALFGLEEQVAFGNQETEEFFFDLREMQPAEKIGVYFYAGAKDYRRQLLGLLLVKPFLASKALIVVDGSNYSSVQQANWDFIAAHRECQLILDLPTPSDGHYTFWNGLQIFQWDINQDSGYTGSNFNESFHNQPFIKALADFSYKFESDKKEVIDKLEKQALALESSDKLLEAESKYKEILQWDSKYANSYHNLGILYYRMERYKNAIAMLVKALEFDSSIGVYYYTLALVLEKVGNTSQAIVAYEKAIALNSQLIDAYNNLGNILSTTGQVEQAESIYRQAIATNSSHFGSYLNLGNVLMAQHQLDEAIEIYQKSLQLKPGDPDTLHNLRVALDIKHDQGKAALYLGNAAYNQGNYKEAIVQYEKVLGNQTGDINFYDNLAECYKKLKQESAAIKAYKEGIKQYPAASYLYLNLVTALQQFGRMQEAIAVANEASQVLPNDLMLKLEKQRLLPVIYENLEEIDFYRNRFTQQLEELLQQNWLNTPEAIKNALTHISFRTNFFLHYQGKNDLYIQRFYGQFVHQIMAANYPQWVKAVPMPHLNKTSKIRVGYISACMYSHTVSHLFIGWISEHNHQNFEVYCYYTDRQVDSTTQRFKTYSQVFRHIPDCHIPKNLETVCQQIIADELHVLVFVEIGMHPALTQIASLRLAPVQCVTWGHPITSGLPTIDYFLSSDLMEPENAEQHYSEKLVCLPNLGIDFAKPVLPETRKARVEFQLRDDAIVYLSCQSLYKYLPQHDYIFAAIAQRVPKAQFAFLARGPSDAITDKFRQRLQKAFDSFGLDSEEYCLMLPKINHQEYLNLNLVSDIFLDTFSWSGGITTLEAIACNLPVVTCPGEFMRGRHSYAILKMLGVTQTIAKDEAEYIEIAVRLGLDKQWRQSIVQEITQNHDRLYSDKTCVEALEAFYQRVVQEGQENNTL